MCRRALLCNATSFGELLQQNISKSKLWSRTRFHAIRSIPWGGRDMKSEARYLLCLPAQPSSALRPDWTLANVLAALQGLFWSHYVSPGGTTSLAHIGCAPIASNLRTIHPNFFEAEVKNSASLQCGQSAWRWEPKMSSRGSSSGGHQIRSAPTL